MWEKLFPTCFISIDNSSSSSTSELPDESQGSCGKLEGLVEAEAPVTTEKRHKA